MLRPESGVLLRLGGRTGACGAGRLGRGFAVGLWLSGEWVWLTAVGVCMRSVRLPTGDRRDIRLAACTFCTVGGSTKDAETGLGWAPCPSIPTRLRRTTLLNSALLGPVSSCLAVGLVDSPVCICLRRRLLDLIAAVLSFLMATSCMSSTDTGLCRIPIGVLNVVCSFFGGSMARQVSNEVLPKSRCARWCFESRENGSRLEMTSATVYMCMSSRTLLVDGGGTGDLDLLFWKVCNLLSEEPFFFVSSYSYSQEYSSNVLGTVTERFCSAYSGAMAVPSE